MSVVRRYALNSAFAVAFLVGSITVVGTADGQEAAAATPPLASGHSMTAPAQITAGDVKARALLLRENLVLIRRYFGRPVAPRPLIRGRDATLDEVFFSALGIGVRVGQLAFEQLRVDGPWERPPLPKDKIAPSDVFRILDLALATTLTVKREIGVTVEPPERPMPDDTDPTELFNLLLEVAGEIDNLVAEKERGTNAYIVVTVLVHQAMQLHLASSQRMMPTEPPFEPNKTPEDVLQVLLACFELIAKISATMDLPVVRLQRVDDVERPATLTDLVDISVMMIAELDRMLRAVGHERDPLAKLAPSRKYPSHVLRRARLLHAILEDLLAARRGKAR